MTSKAPLASAPRPLPRTFRPLFAGVMLLAGCVAARTGWTPDEAASARRQLEEMLAEDQKLISLDTDDERFVDANRRHSEMLERIVARFGWPTHESLGKEASHAAWVIVQHADRDVEFQRRMLPLIETAAEAGQVDRGNLAYLTDRVLINSGKKQRFGTQLQWKGCEPTPEPLEDSGKVNALRAQMDLPPLEDYLSQGRWLCTEGKFGKRPAEDGASPP